MNVRKKFSEHHNLTRMEKKVLELIKSLGLVQAADLEDRGISRRYLPRLAAIGAIARLTRGLYAAPDLDLGELQSLVEVTKLYPDTVICLLSALQLHGLTTQMPGRVWVAVAANARAPSRTTVRLQVVRFSGLALSEGVEQRTISGVTVKAYSIAKTVADCFKLRNKIGLDVALEALRDALRERRATVDAILHYARICRVEAVMTPYIEAML